MIGACLFFAGGRLRLASTLFFLFLPYTIALSTALLNVSVLAMVFVSLFLLLESRGKSLLASLCLGLALATVQFIWLVLPLVAVYYLRQRRWREPLFSSSSPSSSSRRSSSCLPGCSSTRSCSSSSGGRSCTSSTLPVSRG